MAAMLPIARREFSERGCTTMSHRAWRRFWQSPYPWPVATLCDDRLRLASLSRRLRRIVKNTTNGAPRFFPRMM
jgi:hypothetical protein